MAKMFPSNGPRITSSPKAEPDFYQTLQTKLSDEYTVIHSIPWLSSAMKELYDDRSNIGEVDFLIIHPIYGVLAIEVKGGQFNRDASGYYYSQGESRSHFDPHEQLNRGVFALQKLLKDKGIRTRFGKAYYFPRTNFGMNVPPEYIDHYNGKSLRIIIDESNAGKEAAFIEDLMRHYGIILGIKPLGEAGVKQIQECLYPTSNHGPCWVSRIRNDKAWLKLTNDQNYCVSQTINASRYIVTGWPGSGKTLVLIQTCRELVKQGKKTLVFTFHNPLANKIKSELQGMRNCEVLSFYQLCCSYGDSDSYYSASRNVETLKQIVTDNKLSEFDTLLIDEGQAISEEAWKLFIQSFVQKQIIVMCDDAQIFKNEASVSLNFLSSLLDATPFTLTESLRMPKAVCDELYLFNSPKYSVINNRPKDKDSLNRVVTHDQETMLKQAIARLLSDGINKSDICVLKPHYANVAAELVPQGVLVENINQFRGLEKPIVIIYTSEKITNEEFFCAYSRATSRCIILFDANLIEKGMYDKLGKGFLKSNPEKVRTIANKGLIQNRLTEEYHLARESIFSGDIELEWIPKWKRYIVYSEQNPLLQALVASYIEIHNIGALISWCPWDKKYLRLDKAEEIILNQHTQRTHIDLKYCRACNAFTPHESAECIVCSKKYLSGIYVNEKNYKEGVPIEFVDLHLLISNQMCLTKQQRQTICPLLAAILTVVKHKKLFINRKILHALEITDTYLRQVITIFVFFKMQKIPTNQTIKNKEIIAYIKNEVPTITQTMSDASFAAHVATTIKHIVDTGALQRVSQGCYKIIVE